MAFPRFSSPSVPVLKRHVCHIISQRKGIQVEQLDLATNLHRELGFDTLDLVDVILAVEHRFQLSIPDEVPLHTVRDFVMYLAEQLPVRNLFPRPQ